MSRGNTIFYFSGDPFQYGGGATVAYNLLLQIAKTEESPKLLISKYSTLPKEIERGFNVVRVPMPKSRALLEVFDQLLAPFILLFMRPKRVICLNSIVPLLYPLRVDLFFQMRMFYFEDLDSRSKKIKNWLGRMSAKRANNLYCASKDHAKDLQQKLGLEKAKVKVIHLGFEMDERQNDKQVKRNDAMLFVSVIRPYKNLHGLVDAVIKAKELRPDLPIKLDIIGKPANYVGIEDYMNEVHSKISNPKYANLFNFVGPLPHTEVVERLHKCKALVFPTLFEGFGLPLLEAMATKTPVICSDVNSLPEIGAETVEYFDVKNGVSLAEKIIELYEGKYDESKVIDAFERAKQFSWKNASRALMENKEFIVE